MARPMFGQLVPMLDLHAAAFAEALELDLGRRGLKLDSLWVNVLKPGAVHSGHIHPHSAVAGRSMWPCRRGPAG